MASTEQPQPSSTTDSRPETVEATSDTPDVSSPSAALGPSDIPPGTHLEPPSEAPANSTSEDPVAATSTTSVPSSEPSNPTAVPTQPEQTTTVATESKEKEDSETARTRMERQMSTAIGSSLEDDETQLQDMKSGGTTLAITLLLTNGARHPYKIDERYLKKRNVTPTDMDPFNMSVYTLKELILREWREEWEPKPLSPSAIRLIHFGRLLDDKQPLKECRLQADSPNVIHMTVRPQEVIDEEDAKTAKGVGRERDGNDSSPGCRCVIL